MVVGMFHVRHPSHGQETERGQMRETFIGGLRSQLKPDNSGTITDITCSPFNN